ncbi:MAG: histidine kinase dimerization/phospho-acceptor domain-containing protein, partial [Robiginitalea sp.]
MSARITHIALVLTGMLLLYLPGKLAAQEDNLVDAVFTGFISEARSYKNQDKPIPALNALKKAQDWAEEQENPKRIIDVDLMYAELYLDMGEDEKARFHFKQSTDFLENTEYPFGSATNKYIDARLIYRTGNFYWALDALNAAKQENNERNLLNKITLLEGRIYAKLPNNKEKAITRFNALRENTDPFEKDHLKMEAHLALANLYAATGENRNAIQNGEEAFSLAKSNEFSKEYLEVNRLLAELYEKTGLFEKAVLPLSNLLQIRDSVYTSDKRITDLVRTEEVHYGNLNKQIKKLEDEKAELSASANRSEITAILTSGFLTIISLLAVSLYRNNQIKLKTNDLLQTKNRELQLARDSAVQAMETKSNFLSTVSHELRTPLYAVTGLTHLLLEENPRKNQLEHLKSLKFSGDYLLNFINDILQINKIDADKLEPLEMECNLHKVLNEVLNGLQQAAKDHRNELILDYDPQIPAILMSDPVKLSQIFMNLVGNALKFTREGEVVVIAKLLKKDGEHANVYFEVRDNGIGIDKERQATIFDSFEQGSIQ